MEEGEGKKERGKKWTSVLLSPGTTTGLKKKKKKNTIHIRDFPEGPMIKTSPFNAEGAGLIPGRGAKNPHGLLAKKNKTQNKSNTVTNSIKSFKKWSTSKNSTIRPSQSFSCPWFCL